MARVHWEPTLATMLCAMSCAQLSPAQERPAKVPSSCSARLPSLPTITWNSTQKIEQLIGEYDWTCSLDSWKKDNCASAKTTSQTFTKAHVLGNGNGYSFLRTDANASQQQLVFLFGDTAAI